MKKRIEKISQKAVVYLLLLTYVLLLIPTSTVSAASSLETALPTVSLTWKDGTGTVADGAIVGQKTDAESTTLTAVLTITGTIISPVTVTLGNLNISDGVEDYYKTEISSWTFQNGEATTKEFAVTVYAEDYSFQPLGKKVDGVDRQYNSQFGICIAAVTNAMPDKSKNTIRANINIDKSGKTFIVTPNKDIRGSTISEGYVHLKSTEIQKAVPLATKPTIDETKIYSYSFIRVQTGLDPATRNIQSILDYMEMEDVCDFYMDEDILMLSGYYYIKDTKSEYENGAAKYVIDANVSLGFKDSSEKLFSGRIYSDANFSDPDASSINFFKHYYYYRHPAGNDRDVTSQYHDATYTERVLKLKERKLQSGAEEDSDWFRTGEEIGTDRYSTFAPNMYFINIPYPKLKETFTTENDLILTIEQETFDNLSFDELGEVIDVHYALTIVSQEAPAVTGYRLVNAPSYEGGELMVAVDFSKPVQLLNNGASDLKLRVKIGEGEAAQTLTLSYSGGEFTDTLFFSKKLEDDFYASGDVTVVGFTGQLNNTGRIDTQVADLLWTENNKNNLADLSEAVNKVIGNQTIDTRIPTVGLSSCDTRNEELKAHTVNVNIKNMATAAEGGKVYYSWTDSADDSSVIDWTEKSDFTVGVNAFTYQDVTGEYYLHVKAEGANGLSTYWSYGALKFNNDPKIKNAKSETEGEEAQIHTITMDITDATSVSYAWSTSSDYNSVNTWTNKTDFAEGENTFIGLGYHGDYYLHVKAVNTIGTKSFVTHWTSKLTKFNSHSTIRYVSSKTEGETARRHEIVMNITSATSVFYAWSTSSDYNAVTSWESKTDYVEGRNTFVGSGFGGGYYLHIKAVNTIEGNDFITYWTSETVAFDSSPTVKYVSSKTEGKAAAEHKLVMKITNATSVFYAWTKSPNSASVTDWTLKNDFAEGENIFEGKGMNGEYYLHIKAVNAINGYEFSTYWTSKETIFDITPTVKFVSSKTEGKTSKEHQLVIDISEATSVFYAWSESPNHANVTAWTEKSDYVTGQNIFIGKGYTGDYYLHIKAVNAVSGEEYVTYWSSDEIPFNNNPYIQFISCETERKHAKTHLVVMEIVDADVVEYAWSRSADPASVTSWTKKTDFKVGQNTFAGTDMDGEYYLHIKANNALGFSSSWVSAKAYTFDGTPPSAVSITCATAGNALSSHTLNLVMREGYVDDLKYVYMYVKDENGNVIINGKTVYGASSNSDNLLRMSGVNGTIKLTSKSLGITDETAHTYRIGFVFEDASGNKTDISDILYTAELITFDNRDEFDVDIVEDPETEIETVNGYEVLVSGDGLSYEFKFKFDPETPYGAGDTMGITSIVKNGKEIFKLDSSYKGTDPYTDGFGKNNGKDFGIEGITYNPEKQSVTVKVNENAKGYYDFTFFYNEKKASNFPVYFTTENDTPSNFYSISEEGLLSNRVWAFANKRYYRFLVSSNEISETLSYEITSNRYAESGAAPIFSDKEKAYEYALFMELQDVKLVYLGPDSSSIVNLLNGGSSGHFKKAMGETETAKMGQTWILYKNTVWDTAEAPNAQDYAYYFYSNQQETTLDYDRVMRLLIGEALEKHSKAISNYDNGEWTYLTANAGGVDGNGEPNYRKDAVFDDTLTYKGPFSQEITYKGDSEIYSTTISNIHGYETIDEAYLLANYAFTSDGGRTVLFFREYNGAGNVGEYTEVAVPHGSSVKLKSIVFKTGVYEFIEFDGNGSRKFYVYADYYAPTLLYEYTQSEKTAQGYIDRYVNGSTIRVGTLTLKSFVTEAGGYTPEYDKHAYLYITNTSGKVIAFMTATELRESGGYTLTENTVIIYLYDRLGNVVSATVRANESDLYATATIKDEQMLILDINRTADEIAIGGFKIYKDNVLLELDYSQTFTFYESGKYTIELADIYGNTYTETFTFQRPLPVVEFQCQDEGGDYVPMGGDVNGSAYVLSLGDGTYQVTASTEIRLKYDASQEYEFTILSGEPTLKHTRSGSQYVRIVDNGSEWTLKIAHKKDPSTYIIVTCGHDTTPPSVFAQANQQKYSWNEFVSGENVLFEELSSTLVEVKNGQTMNCYSISLEWNDENDIRSVTLTRDGKIVPLTQTNLSDKSMRVSGFGDYVLTVTDILNNTTIFKFRIAVTSGVDYYIDGKKTDYSDDPIKEIVGGAYTDTQYTNKDVRLVLTEFGNVSFLYRNETSSGIYQIRYSENGIELYYLRNRTYIFLQKVSAAGGELFTTISHAFKLNYEIRDGKLNLLFPTPAEGAELWQIRVTGVTNDVPTIIQFERADRVTNIRLVEVETGELLETNAKNEEVYSGAKSAVKVYEPSITGAIVKISSYYSEKETFDFYRKDEMILYGEGKNLSELKDEGYYKIVALDIYGNSQIIYLRIGFGFEAVVKIIYATEEIVEYSVEKSGSFSAKSNHSVQFTIWAERDSCTIKAEKDGVAFTPESKSARRYFSFTIGEVGEYKILVDDGCGNVLNFTVSIKAPTEIVYNDYLTGFNENAPYRDKLYTNDKVSVVYDKLMRDGIKYVFYRVTQDDKTSAKTVIFNLLTPNPAEYKAEDFISCIGKEGNGAYEIVFADEYGNHVSRTVRISDGGQLSVSRLIETGSVPELLDLQLVLTEGAWSNRSVILSDSAEASVLKIDGEEIFFTNHEYILTFPAAFAEGYEAHTVDYLDEYGNRYEFTIHLLKQFVEVSLLGGVELITIGDEQYAKGGVGYTWTDSRVTAYYTVGSVTAPYENGQRLSDDGKYVISFVDYAGNTVSKTVRVDTMVNYKLVIGHVRVPSGIATNEIITVDGNGETINVVSIMKDGELLETKDLTFEDHGSYEVVLSDVVGNTATVTFMVISHPVTELSYLTNGNYAIAGVWMLDGADKLSYISEIVIDGNGRQGVLLKKSGSYEVDLKDLQSGLIYTFSAEVDHTPPSVSLLGVDEGGSTREDVTLMGIVAGDRVDVYKDGTLIYSQRATKTVEKSPSISEPGEYRVVISDEAGNSLEYEFVREFTSNAASNIIILMLLFLVGASGFIFLIINGKAKVR